MPEKTNEQEQDLKEFEAARKAGHTPYNIFGGEGWQEKEGEYLGTGKGYASISTCTRSGIMYKVWQGISAHRNYTFKKL